MLQLRLLSWNVHGPPRAPRRTQRLAAVAAEIARRAPDLVLLQEVWFRRDAEHLCRLLAAGYEAIAERARAWPLRAGGLLAFRRRDAPWRADAAPVRFHPFAVSASRWRLWEGDGIARKGVQQIAVRSDAGARAVLLNTHVQAQYRAIRHEAPRRAQLEQLGRLAAQIDPALPVIAAGDFNTGPDEPLYAAVLARDWLDLTNPYRAAHPDAATQFDCGPEPLWIDYVLARRSAVWTVTAALELIANSARDEPFSDHHGLFAEIIARRQ